MERACRERDSLAQQLASKERSLSRAEKRWEASERDLSQIRRDFGAKVSLTAEAQATCKALQAKVGLIMACNQTVTLVRRQHASISGLGTIDPCLCLGEALARSSACTQDCLVRKLANFEFGGKML